VIRPARWLPLSLALHAAIFCTALWVARELTERPLFVDLTLSEPDEHAGAAGGRGPVPAPEPTKRAAPSPRGTATTASPARARASAASSAAAPTPAAALTPSPPVATSSPVAPAANPSLVVESSPTVEPSRTAEPAPAVQPSPTIEPSPARGSSVAGIAPSVSGASADSASVGAGGGEARGAASGGAAATAPTASGGGGGQLALAVPGAGGAEMYGPYLASLRRRLQEMLEYPPAARRRGLSGTVDLEIALESTGRVSEVVLVRSSSHAMLDEAALHAARNLSRVPFPPDVRPRALRVRLPVVFELR